MGMALPVLLVGRLAPLYVSAILLGFLLFNLLLFHRLFPQVFVHKRTTVLSDRGIWLYPLVLLMLSVVLAQQPLLLLLAWCMLAFGDGASALAGYTIQGPALVWHPVKTWTGAIAFVVIGTLGTMAALWLAPTTILLGLTSAQLWAIVATTALACAIVETLPWAVNDNITVTGTAVAVGAVALASLQQGGPQLSAIDVLVLGAIGLGAIVAYLKQTLDAPGSLAGWLVAGALYVGAGWLGIIMLGTFFIAGTLATRWQLEKKQRMGLAEGPGGQRSYQNVLANGLVPAVAGLLAWVLPLHAELFIALAAAAVASITADTLASEVGNVLGSRYMNIISFKKGQRGHDGVVSLEGTLAGAAGSLAIALLYLLFCGNWAAAALILIAGVFGCLADSVLGATLQKRGHLNNHTVNLASALLAALLALGCLSTGLL